MNKKRESFLEQTAKDYDLDLEVVRDVFRKYGLGGLYEKLEEIIRENN